MAKRQSQPALMVRVLVEIGQGRIHEQFIKDKDCYIHGQTDGLSIKINPAIAVCDTLLHEAIHRLEPSWDENYVRNRTSYLLRRMSDEQIQQLYETYEVIRKRRRKRAKPRVQPVDSGDPGAPRVEEQRLRLGLGSAEQSAEMRKTRRACVEGRPGEVDG
jgi:hypothetical protein